MASCHQSASLYRSQCWPRSMSPYGVIRSKWFNQNQLILSTAYRHGGCRWPGATLAPGQLQPSWWLHYYWSLKYHITQHIVLSQILWYSNAIWHNVTWTAFSQVMACGFEQAITWNSSESPLIMSHDINLLTMRNMSVIKMCTVGKSHDGIISHTYQGQWFP